MHTTKTLSKRTWLYGTTRRAKLLESRRSGVQVVVDELKEGHVLVFGAGDKTAQQGDSGILTFTKGGPTGGFWKFTKTP